MIKIAISITTHNRYEVFRKSYEQILKFKPKSADIFIVDDGSTIPVKEATFRFETPQGIAVAKNKAFELADGYDYHFAFDDDVYPIKKDWHLEYINTGLNHLCFTFDTFSNGRPNGRIKVAQYGNIVHYEEPCGCMNFYTKKCFDVVGGMDVVFGKWSYEHVSHSMRIHKAGLTPYPFMDIANSLELFYSFDWDQTTKRSIDQATRNKLAKINERIYRDSIESSRYIPYKPERNLILTCLFTTLIDPQRGFKWGYYPDMLDTLRNSVPDGVDFVCLTDDGHWDFTEYEFPVKPKHSNPYLAKWIAFKEFIEAHTEYDNIFCVDGTDVEVLNNPFPHIERGKLYVADEPVTLNNDWLKRNHGNYATWIEQNKSLPLLNAGICGGHRDVLLRVLSAICRSIDVIEDHGLTDMACFNYVVSRLEPANLVHGRQVNTVFKRFDKRGIYRERGVMNKSWFRHK